MSEQADTERHQREMAKYRSFLLVLARRRFPEHLRGRLDPSDVVQETLLQAYCDRGHLRGGSEQELLGWLCTILMNNLRDAIKGHGRARRDVGRELALDHTNASSSLGLGLRLASPDRSPHTHVARTQDLLRMAQALESLEPEQRLVIELYYFDGRTQADIAVELGCHAATVSRLLRRGLTHLSAELHREEAGHGQH